jgi:hypothetical protein
VNEARPGRTVETVIYRYDGDKQTRTFDRVTTE